jgi:serine/threonine-protein kinase
VTDENLPRRFGKYTLIRHLATGGMAEIYLAIHRSIQGFEKLVVIKRILPKFSEDEEFIRMFLAEARIAATLNHPNIIQIFDVGSVHKDYFIAMEYVHGEDLRSIVGAMRKAGFKEFPIEMALGISRGLCKGLSYAHDHKGLDGEPLNIVHRDISPQNTIVTFPGEVKIVDFGIARAAMKDMEGDKEKGALRGKFPYMSPEQCRGRDLDGRSDLFSVAIILFELTTGRRLFKGKTEIDTIRRIVEQPYPRPSELKRDYDPDLEEIVMKGLARDRDQRYASARDLGEALDEYIVKHRIKVTALEMSRFMESLFADKLAQQRELMKEGKKLADIVAEQEVEEVTEMDFLDMTNIPTTGGTPGAMSMTASGVQVQPRKRTSPAVFAVIALLVLAVGGLGAFLGLNVLKARREAALRIGVIEVKSDPSGASVWIDGERQKGATPLAVEKLKVGIEYTVKITREGYEPFERKVLLTPENPQSGMSITLTELAPVGDGVLKLSVVPRDAVIIFDGKEQGKGGQATITGVKPGAPHSLLVQQAECNDHTETIRLKAGEVKEISLELETRPLGQDEFLLGVVTDPEGASVTVDGEKLSGVTPLKKRLPWKKSVALLVELAKHKDYEETIKPKKGGPVELRVELKKKAKATGGGTTGTPTGGTGTLVLDATPWANVTIPGVGKFVTPFRKELPSGKYKITLSNPSGASKTISITIGPGETVRKKVDLQ